jgi:hypothetical protein
MKKYQKKMKSVKTWQTSLSKCPYCNKSIHVVSLSSRSEKESIGNVINLSKIHLEKCRGDKEKKLCDISIKVKSITDKSEITHWRVEKMLSY